jgi:hypothetical protein
MAYAGSDKVLLFGGDDYYSGGIKDETWIFDLSENNWTQLSLPNHPSARFKLDMAYIGENRVLMFGGRDSTEYFAETWLYEHTEPQPPEVTVLQPVGGEILTGSATISWIATDPDSGDSTQLLIDLDYSGNGGGSWSVIDTGQANDGDYLWDVSSLPDGMDYRVRLTATDPGGKSAADSSASDFTIDNTPHPPLAVDDLAVALADTALFLYWTAITEDTAGNTITVPRYVIYRGTVPDFLPGPADSIGAASATYYFDTTSALQDTEVQHYYAVKAVDPAGGKSSQSNHVGEFDHYITRVK